MKKHPYIFGLSLFLIALVSFITGTIASGGSFPDVKSSDWFYPYVMKIKDWGVVAGNDDGTFAPSNNINRAEFSKMLSLYDERVDEKIDQKLLNIDTASNSSSDSSYTPAIMYLNAYNKHPVKCPAGWDEVQNALQWSYSGSQGWERTCMAKKACSVLHLDAFKEQPAQCPSGWDQAGLGIRSHDQTNGYSLNRRTCYTCFD